MVDVLLGAHLVGILVVVGNSTAKHDSLEVELLTQFATILIHASCQSQSTEIGMDKHLYAIKDVSIWIMSIEGLVACHLCIGVVTLHQIVVNDDREGASHYTIVNHYHHLAFREYGIKLLDLCSGPKHILVTIDTFERTCELVIVIHLEITQLNFVDVVRFHCLPKILSYPLSHNSLSRQ